jgi:hypothetical protein
MELISGKTEEECAHPPEDECEDSQFHWRRQWQRGEEPSSDPEQGSQQNHRSQQGSHRDLSLCPMQTSGLTPSSPAA